ncbi:MAG: hypothetical protein ABFS24_15085 [Pseudomonadota bacterium]
MVYKPAGRDFDKKGVQADFSPQAITRAVLKSTAQKPYVLYPAAAGILGGMAALLLSPSWLFVVPAALGVTVGLGAWAVDATIRREQHASEYLNHMQKILAGRVDRTIRTLEKELREVESKQGLGQLERLRSKYHAFEELLRRKLDPDEITFRRYLGMTEQVFLAGLDNLKHVSDILKGSNAIDEVHVRQRLQDLDGQGSLPTAEQREYSTLEARLELLGSQRVKVQEWFSQNEAAMTQMDSIMAAIAEMDTANTHAVMGMESAMQELGALAERAKSYSRNRPI